MQIYTPAPHRPALTGMDINQLRTLCAEAGVKSIHAERLNAFIFRHAITNLDAIPDLPQALRNHLQQHTRVIVPQCTAHQRDADGTQKLLLAMPDGKEVESVLIPGAGRITQCISSQVGCAVGCNFCLTATAGLTRNLTAAEMVAQVMTARNILGEYPRNLVLMGMGEPLHNYDGVSRFVRIAADPQGMAFSPRRITLSTAGLVPGIRQMIADRLPCNLAVSLNATTDAVRDVIMPVNRKYPIAELMAAVRDYLAAHDRKRVLIEYVLLAGINDDEADAHRLCELLEGIDSTVNLLPFNAHAGSDYQRPADATVSTFRSILIDAGKVAVVRESRGRDISAACGQLKTDIAQRRARTGSVA